MMKYLCEKWCYSYVQQIRRKYRVGAVVLSAVVRGNSSVRCAFTLQHLLCCTRIYSMIERDLYIYEVYNSRYSTFVVIRFDIPTTGEEAVLRCIFGEYSKYFVYNKYSARPPILL